MRFLRRKRKEPAPEEVEDPGFGRRRFANADLRRQIDRGEKQAVEYQLADSQNRATRNAERVARVEKLAEVLNIRHAREARDS